MKYVKNTKLRYSLKFQVGELPVMDTIKPPYNIKSMVPRRNLFLTAWCSGKDINFRLTHPIVIGEIESLTEHVVAWATLILESEDGFSTPTLR